MKRAVGYRRVSGKDQIENESLSIQSSKIREFAKNHNYKLSKIYSDEGISGATVDKRQALVQLLADAEKGKFDALIIKELDRFGRDNLDIMNNIKSLENFGVVLHSVKEQVDFGTDEGQLSSQIFGAIAEFERKKIRQRTIGGRISKANRKIPTAGKLPFARIYDKETGKWSLDKEKARLLNWAAKEYLNGGSLRDISEELKTVHDLPLGYTYLLYVLKDRCGNKWTVNYKGHDPITYDIPPILDQNTIDAIRDRVEHNRTDNRTDDVRKYLLTGFIRCGVCGKSLSGQTQGNKAGKEFQYYRHPANKYENCKAFSSISLNVLENAIFHEIFQNMFDIPSYKEAIKDALPDENHVRSLKADITKTEKKLKKFDAKLNKLVKMALEGTLQKTTIKKTETEFIVQKDRLTERLESSKSKLESLPDIKDVEKEAEAIRLEVLCYFQFADTLHEKSFDEKKRLLLWLFSGKDEASTPYGVYITRKDNDTWDLLISGKFFRGSKTITASEFQDKVIKMKEPPLAAMGEANKKEYREYVNTLRHEYKTNSLTSVL